MDCFSGHLMSAASDQKLFCELCSVFFQWICRRESGLPVLFLRHLGSSPQVTYLKGEKLYVRRAIAIICWKLAGTGVVRVLQEGGPLLGPKTGLLSNTRKWIVRGDTCADKARDFLGKGLPGGEQESEGTQGNCSVTWLTVSGFMVMELVSGLSLTNHSNSESFLVVHFLFSQDGCQREGFWEVGGQVVSTFDISWTLLVGGGLLVPCSLPGPPVLKQLMQMVTMVPGQDGWFKAACFP